MPRIIACDCAVQVDPRPLVDMLRNLTINAQRACKGIAGAAITLRCQRQGEHRCFHSGRYRLRHPCRRPAPRDEALYGGQVRSRADGGSGIGLALCAPESPRPTAPNYKSTAPRVWVRP